MMIESAKGGSTDRGVLRDALIQQLDTAAANFDAGDISLLVDSVENLMIELLKPFLATSLRDHQYHRQSDDQVISFTSERKYSICIIPDPINPSTLKMVMRTIGRTPGTQLMESVQRNINAIGKIEKLSILVPPGAISDLDAVADRAVYFLEEAYSWLYQKIVSSISKSRTDVQSKLLAILRREINVGHKPLLMDSVWLVMTNKDRITYGLDTKSVESFFKAARTYGIDVGMSKAKIVSEVISRAIPYDLSFSKEAWTNESSIELDITKARYQENHTALQLSQEAIYDGSMILKPLQKINDISLLAIYPSVLQNNVEPILSNCSTGFKNAISKAGKRYFDGMKRLETGSFLINSNKIAELAGSFTRGLIDIS